MNHRGVYVIDFIGNGKASRALIRKGKLQFVVRNSSAGQISPIFDEQNQPAARGDALARPARSISPNKDGTIVVPIRNAPGRQPIVLSLGGFSSLGFVRATRRKTIASTAAMYVDREELIGRRTAELIVRPQLIAQRQPVSLKVLEDVRLVITSTDLDSVVTTKEVPDFKLFDDRETIYEFQVPQRLAEHSFRAQGQDPKPEPEQEDRSDGRTDVSRSTKSTRPTRPRTCISPTSATIT